MLVGAAENGGAVDPEQCRDDCLSYEWLNYASRAVICGWEPGDAGQNDAGTDMTTAAITLFALLLVKHFVCDFVLQTPWQIAQKGIYGAPGGLVHSGIHIAGTLLALLAVMPPLSTIATVLVVEFLVHYHIDWSKEQTVRRLNWRVGARFWNAIGFDQLLHSLTYLAIVVYVTGWVR